MTRTNTTWSGVWKSIFSSHGEKIKHMENMMLANKYQMLLSEDDCGR